MPDPKHKLYYFLLQQHNTKTQPPTIQLIPPKSASSDQETHFNTMTSRIEQLPSELLYEIGDYLHDDLSAIRSFRSTSRRLSCFGPLMEQVDVYATWQSLKNLMSVAEDPMLRKQVRTVICWVPFFYQSLTCKQSYNWRVENHMSDSRLPLSRPKSRRYLPLTRPLVEAEDLGTCRYLDYIEAEKRFGDVYSRDRKKDHARYTEYYAGQELILSHTFVPKLSAALAAFPRLRTVRIVCPETVTGIASFLTKKQFPFLYTIGLKPPLISDFHEPFLDKVKEAIAKSGRSLKNLTVDDYLLQQRDFFRLVFAS